MSRFSFTRDNILSPQERLNAARKCVSNLHGPFDAGQMSDKHASDFESIAEKIEVYGCSERQLAYLRDLNDRY